MADVSKVIAKLLGGVDEKTIEKVAYVVVQAVSKLKEEPYVMIPKKDIGNGKVKSLGKKPRRWGKVIDAIDYTAKPTGYALKGNWANIYDLSKHPQDTVVMINIPYIGLLLGKVVYHSTHTGKYANGNQYEVKHFVADQQFDDGQYANVITRCRQLGVPQEAKVSNG